MLYVDTIEAVCPQMPGQKQQADKQMLDSQMVGHDKSRIVRDEIDEFALSQDRNQKLCNLQPEGNSGYGSQQGQERCIGLKSPHGSIEGEGYFVAVDGKQSNVDQYSASAYCQRTGFVKIPFQMISEENRQMVILKETGHFHQHKGILGTKICLRQGNSYGTENCKEAHCDGIIPMLAEHLSDETVSNDYAEKKRDEPGRVVEAERCTIGNNILDEIDERDFSYLKDIQLAQQGGQYTVEYNPEKIGKQKGFHLSADKLEQMLPGLQMLFGKEIAGYERKHGHEKRTVREDLREEGHI